MNYHADLNWLKVAHAVAERSRCVRSKVGCAIVTADGRVCGSGYNGPPSGYTPAEDERRSPCSTWCPRSDTPSSGAADFSDCPSVHAEINALLYTSRADRLGGTAYLTRDPCWACAKALAASGLRRVVWPGVSTSDREAEVMRYLLLCGLEVMLWNGPPYYENGERV